MKIEKDLKNSAQALADKIHQWLINNDPNYANSVAIGQTLVWDTPKQPLDNNGNAINAKWKVVVKERMLASLTPAEIQEIS